MLFVYDSLNKRLPAILNNLYTYSRDIHSYNTRASSKLKLSLPEVDTTTHGLNSIEYQSIKDWNKLIDENPSEIIQDLPRSKIKTILMKYLLNIID